MAVAHGGLQQSELDALGLSRADVLDLSANLNPLGPHSGVLRAAAQADLRHYPPADAGPLRDALASGAQLDAARVLVTPGATAAIHLAAHALLETGDTCRVFTPTFGEYAEAARSAGARVLEAQFASLLDGGGLEGATSEAARLTVLCNPNNPTGEYLERARIDALLEIVIREGGTLLLDVAYDSFVLEAWDADDLARADAPVVVVHSMTKLHAVPGVRLGYATGAASVLDRLRALQPSWSVGASAIDAGLLALQVEPQQRAAALEVAQSQQTLGEALRRAGLEVRAGRANFMMVRVGDGAAFRGRLLRMGFAVRDCASFGMPEWVRVAMPPAGALGRLATAFVRAAEPWRADVE